MLELWGTHKKSIFFFLMIWCQKFHSWEFVHRNKCLIAIGKLLSKKTTIFHISTPMCKYSFSYVPVMNYSYKSLLVC